MNKPKNTTPEEATMQFRKKPVVIDATRTATAMKAAREDWKALPEWLADAYKEGRILFLPTGIDITTLEGTMRAEPADWIIRGVQGEIYPCKPDIFAATYDRVEG